jgi:predicted thioesterase
MGEKRASCRVRRRLPVVFSDGKQQHRGQTANLSRTGACIHSDYVVAPGTEVALTMGLPGIADVSMQAVVEWARKLRGSETLQASSSMGIRFVTGPGPEYDDFMSVIEEQAQAHGLTAKAAPGRGAAPAAPRREPLPVVPVEPSRFPAPRRVPAIDTRRPSPRRAPAIDPRREPEPDAPAQPRREIVELHTPIIDIQPRRTESAPAPSRPEKHLDFVVGPDDLAAPTHYPCSLSTSRVAWLLEQGAADLAAPRLRGRMATIGLSLEVAVPREPLAVGTPLSVVVALTTVDGDQRTFLFDIEITAGDRLVASGRHVRTVVEPASV